MATADCTPQGPKQGVLFEAELGPELASCQPQPPAKRRRLRVVQPPLRNLDPDLDSWVERATQSRPRIRADCDREVGDGPCAFVGCRYHMWSDDPDDGDLSRRTRWFEHLVDTVEPEHWGETCALRVADRVVVRASETGKWIAASSDGEPIATPGPVLVDAGAAVESELSSVPVGGHGRRRWHPFTGEFARPERLDAAVLGRLLGGLSREQIRKVMLSAFSQVREDASVQEFADAAGLHVDQLLDVDEE